MIKRHHLSELLRNFRFGTRIRFEHHLERWRRWLNVPLQGVQGQGSSHCTGCRCQEVHTQPQTQSHFPGQRLCASLMKAFEPNKLQFPFFERGNPKRLKKLKLRLRKVVVQKMKEESKGRPTQTHSDNAAK